MGQNRPLQVGIFEQREQRTANSVAVRYITSPDGSELDEEDITEDLLEEIVRTADVGDRD